MHHFNALLPLKNSTSGFHVRSDKEVSPDQGESNLLVLVRLSDHTNGRHLYVVLFREIGGSRGICTRIFSVISRALDSSGILPLVDYIGLAPMLSALPTQRFTVKLIAQKLEPCSGKRLPAIAPDFPRG